MDEWDEPIEETGAFDRQGEENSSAADPGWKDELNLAEFPIAASAIIALRRPRATSISRI